jgi:hypothetical protein
VVALLDALNNVTILDDYLASAAGLALDLLDAKFPHHHHGSRC